MVTWHAAIVDIYFASCADIYSNAGFVKEMERDWTG
jgi:hypothetical protein